MHVKKTYLDYAASTPVDGRVLEAMLPYFSGHFGNPSSIHMYGQAADYALEQAREVVAESLNSKPSEIIFTGCGTESDNLALRGGALARRKQTGANRLLISPVEHHAVLHTAEQLRDEFGFELELLPVDEFGQVDPAAVAERLSNKVAVVSAVFANNEIGTINPIAEIGAICRKFDVPFHTDAVQAAAWLDIDVVRESVDLLALGAHKFYGPKGVGALYVREGVKPTPSQTGGKQEYGLRAGTQNVPLIVGMAEALKLARKEREKRISDVLPLRDILIDSVLSEIPRSKLTGHPVNRLPNHASFVFEGVDGNALLMQLDMAGFACSSGSACRVGTPKPSEILTSIGIASSWALGSLRVTLGKDTTPGDINSFLDFLPGLIARVRHTN